MNKIIIDSMFIVQERTTYYINVLSLNYTKNIKFVIFVITYV
jgi:hypothetical protein